MPLANTIDDVVSELTEIIAKAKAEGSRLGYFPALYRRVTREVKRGIERGRFVDGPRMAHLDVVFANRYLAAYDAWQVGAGVSDCWALAFGAAGRTDTTIVQHLLAGMNAHINLDLAVAAAEVAPGHTIHSLHSDFQQINRILAEQINDVQDAIASVAPMMWMLDLVGGQREERMVEFSLERARDAAWVQALVMAELSGEEREAAIGAVDRGVTLIGSGVLHPPGWMMRAALGVIVRSEERDVTRVIAALE